MDFRDLMNRLKSIETNPDSIDDKVDRMLAGAEAEKARTAHLPKGIEIDNDTGTIIIDLLDYEKAHLDDPNEYQPHVAEAWYGRNIELHNALRPDNQPVRVLTNLVMPQSANDDDDEDIMMSFMGGEAAKKTIRSPKNIKLIQDFTVNKIKEFLGINATLTTPMPSFDGGVLTVSFRIDPESVKNLKAMRSSLIKFSN